MNAPWKIHTIFDLLTIPQKDKLSKWMKKQDKAVLRQQKSSNDPHLAVMTVTGEPYYGPVGGAYTYHITPTSVGTAVKVSNSVTKEEIDLTEYESW